MHFICLYRLKDFRMAMQHFNMPPIQACNPIPVLVSSKRFHSIFSLSMFSINWILCTKCTVLWIFLILFSVHISLFHILHSFEHSTKFALSFVFWISHFGREEIYRFFGVFPSGARDLNEKSIFLGIKENTPWSTISNFTCAAHTAAIEIVMSFEWMFNSERDRTEND